MPPKRVRKAKAPGAKRATGKLKVGDWTTSTINLNQKLCDMLQRIRDAEIDHFKKRAYSKAIDVIQTYGEPINDAHTKAEWRRLPGVGKSMAAKIQQFIEEGTIGKYEEVMTDPGAIASEELAAIHGLGEKAKKGLLDAGVLGVRSLLAQSNFHDGFTLKTKLGLKFIHEFNTPAPRDEVHEIVQRIKAVAAARPTPMDVHAASAYRRGKPVPAGEPLEVLVTTPSWTDNEDPTTITKKIPKAALDEMKAFVRVLVADGVIVSLYEPGRVMYRALAATATAAAAYPAALYKNTTPVRLAADEIAAAAGGGAAGASDPDDSDDGAVPDFGGAAAAAPAPAPAVAAAAFSVPDLEAAEEDAEAGVPSSAAWADAALAAKKNKSKKRKAEGPLVDLTTGDDAPKIEAFEPKAVDGHCPRRVVLRIIPTSVLGPALLHFTGPERWLAAWTANVARKGHRVSAYAVRPIEGIVPKVDKAAAAAAAAAAADSDGDDDCAPSGGAAASKAKPKKKKGKKAPRPGSEILGAQIPVEDEEDVFKAVGMAYAMPATRRA